MGFTVGVVGLTGVFSARLLLDVSVMVSRVTAAGIVVIGSPQGYVSFVVY